jgi:hypothetical protein
LKKGLLLLMTVPVILLTAGCAEERIPADKAEAWEAVEEKPATSTPEPEAAVDAGKAAVGVEIPPDAIALLHGAAFTIEGKPATAAGEDAMSRAHYFEALASVELQSSATLMETDIAGQNANGAVPVIGLYVEAAEGGRPFANSGRPVDGPQLLKDKVQLGPGKYTVRLTYFKDTAGAVRPRVTLRSITFK